MRSQLQDDHGGGVSVSYSDSNIDDWNGSQDDSLSDGGATSTVSSKPRDRGQKPAASSPQFSNPTTAAPMGARTVSSTTTQQAFTDLLKHHFPSFFQNVSSVPGARALPQAQVQAQAQVQTQNQAQPHIQGQAQVQAQLQTQTQAQAPAQIQAQQQMQTQQQAQSPMQSGAQAGDQDLTSGLMRSTEEFSAESERRRGLALRIRGMPQGSSQ